VVEYSDLFTRLLRSTA